MRGEKLVLRFPDHDFLKIVHNFTINIVQKSIEMFNSGLVVLASYMAAWRAWSRAIFDDPDNMRLLIKAATR